MNKLSQIRVPLLAAAIAAFASICSAGQAGRELIINGQPASTDLKVINGRTYAPLADIAKALGMSLVSKPNSVEMTTAGGAGQVEGRPGKMGDVMFTGKWRFTPVSLEEVAGYTEKYTGDGKMVTPRSAGETLFVLNCRLKNAQKDSQEILCSTLHCGHTALTDDMEHGYSPYSYDAHNETGAYGGPRLLPGAASEFAVIFSVPKGTKPQSIIFSVMCGGDWMKGGTDLRIAAKP